MVRIMQQNNLQWTPARYIGANRMLPKDGCAAPVVSDPSHPFYGQWFYAPEGYTSELVAVPVEDVAILGKRLQ